MTALPDMHMTVSVACSTRHFDPLRRSDALFLRGWLSRCLEDDAFPPDAMTCADLYGAPVVEPTAAPDYSNWFRANGETP
jgi:hypothetical protein